MSAEAFNLCDALETHQETMQWEQEQKAAQLSTSQPAPVAVQQDRLSDCQNRQNRKIQHSNIEEACNNNGSLTKKSNERADTTWRTKHSISKPVVKSKTLRAPKQQE